MSMERTVLTKQLLFRLFKIILELDTWFSHQTTVSYHLLAKCAHVYIYIIYIIYAVLVYYYMEW